jgi:hypothetical protein
MSPQVTYASILVLITQIVLSLLVNIKEDHTSYRKKLYAALRERGTK